MKYAIRAEQGADPRFGRGEGRPTPKWGEKGESIFLKKKHMKRKNNTAFASFLFFDSEKNCDRVRVQGSG